MYFLLTANSVQTPQAPSIPPRTYPQLPPSSLPILLAGLVRIMKWVAGGSLALLVIYYVCASMILQSDASTYISIAFHPTPSDRNFHGPPFDNGASTDTS